MSVRHISLFAAFFPVLASSAAGAEVPRSLSTFLDQHCVECHDSDVKKGGLDLSALPFDLGKADDFKHWQRVFERVRDGEMPPAKKPQPVKEQAGQFLAELGEPLRKADAADIAANGRVRGRRLTRAEYEHTLHDLLGIDIPLKDLLPEDRASHGFETVADGQQLSYHQLGRYLDVADQALNEAFDRALKGDAPFQRHCTPEDLAKKTGGNYRGPDLRDGKSLSWPITLQFFGRMKATEVPEDGWYRITLRDVQAVNPGKDGAVWGTLRSGVCYSNAPMLYMIGVVEATSQPRDLVYEAWIQKDHILELKPNDGTLKKAATGASGGNVSFKGRNLAKDGFAGISHRGIDIARIHRHDHLAVCQNLFGITDISKVTAQSLDGMISRFATRAFRRSVPADQCAPYAEMARKALADGKPAPEALRIAYRAILCSPRFLTFIEAPGKLDDHAIASRLSYAFWVSMPDEELIKAADASKLHEPEMLRKQVSRMLVDAKAKRFVSSFTDQWLKLNQIDFTSPDTRQFPTFDPVVQESMLEETRAYFAELVTKDLSISHLVDSDFAFLNGRLASHYNQSNQHTGLTNKDKRKDEKRKSKGKNKDKQKEGEDDDDEKNTELKAGLPGVLASSLVPGEGLQRVALNPQAFRGGLVTQGAVLKVTADGTSTSPVVRGVFVNERILGEEIHPPPPGIPAIEPDIRGATSIRDQLSKHRSSESCAACHNMIDPPGFALESFDPVGGWRSRYGKGDTGAKVDPSGLTPHGDPFSDLAAWKQVYLKRSDQLTRGFAKQFLTYATGAPPRFSTDEALDQIVKNAAKSDYGMRSVILESVLSEMFLRK